MLKSLVRNLRGKKSSHVKGWCGLGRVRSLGDFDGLDALELWFLSHMLVPQVTNKLANKKKMPFDPYILGNILLPFFRVLNPPI
jgi:hypothetical protein